MNEIVKEMIEIENLIKENQHYLKEYNHIGKQNIIKEDSILMEGFVIKNQIIFDILKLIILSILIRLKLLSLTIILSQQYILFNCS
jgi:hypothetical protein